MPIHRLKEKGLSWRKISQYLQKYEGFEVTHVYLQNSYEEIARARELQKIAMDSAVDVKK